MKPSKQTAFPYLGFGLGLRPDHYEVILAERPNLDWLEIITENYLVSGGKPLYYLDRIREHYPMVMHGVSLSIGSSDPIDLKYLHSVRELAQRVEPAWISDHLCWTGVNGINMHDLLPLPYTPETIKHVVSHIQQVQEFLGRRILIENVSSYLTYEQSAMSEWEFLTEIARAADCYILLDVNNIYVSAFNHGFDPLDYLRGIPKDRVVQIHLAGHSNHGDYIIDTHDAPVIQPVWDLFALTLQHFGAVSTMIERDDNIPALPELLAEVDHARAIAENVLQEQACEA
ncbi:MAG: DUF692 domain-containing protein [Pseudomonadota bacterium]